MEILFFGPDSTGLEAAHNRLMTIDAYRSRFENLADNPTHKITSIIVADTLTQSRQVMLPDGFILRPGFVRVVDETAYIGIQTRLDVQVRTSNYEDFDEPTRISEVAYNRLRNEFGLSYKELDPRTNAELEAYYAAVEEYEAKYPPTRNMLPIEILAHEVVHFVNQ